MILQIHINYSDFTIYSIYISRISVTNYNSTQINQFKSPHSFCRSLIIRLAYDTWTIVTGLTYHLSHSSSILVYISKLNGATILAAHYRSTGTSKSCCNLFQLFPFASLPILLTPSKFLKVVVQPFIHPYNSIPHIKSHTSIPTFLSHIFLFEPNR